MARLGLTHRRIGLAVGGLGLLAILVLSLTVGTGGRGGPGSSGHEARLAQATPGTALPPSGSAPAEAAVGAPGAAGGATVAGSETAGAGTAGTGAGGAGVSAGSSGSSLAGPGQAPPAPLPAVPTRVIKNGQIDLQVPRGRVAATIGSLTTLAAAEGGFVAATSSSQADSTPAGAVTLRVPAAAFELTVNKVRALGRVQSVTTSGQDVTAQYVDLQARITALQQAQSRYLTILTRANSVGDILAVQQQVDAVDSQLEQLEGQQRVMDDQTTYGTLVVNVDERSAAPTPPRPAAGPWSRAFRRAGDGFAYGLQGLVSASGALAFAALCVAAIGLLGWRGWRRLRGGAPAAPASS